METRFRVDWIRCDGYGLCGDLVPDLIDLDEWRYPIVRREPVDNGRMDDAQRAVDCCPMKALFLERTAAEDRRPDARRSPSRDPRPARHTFR